MQLDNRTRWMATAMSLAILLVLPLPDFSANPGRITAVFLLWVGSLAFSYICFFKPAWIPTAWIGFIIVSVFQLLVLKNPITLCLTVIWRFWLRARLKKIELSSVVKAAVFLVALLGLRGNAVPAAKPGQTGFKVEGFASCNLVDSIPWAFRKTKRESRFLIRDKMRLATQPDFSIWEIYQVLDSRGYIAYVFRRIRDDGTTEAIVTKEAAYNRILEKGKTRRITEVRNLKTLLNKAVLTWYTPHGASVSFLPSLGDKAKLQVNFSGVNNRLVPPLFLEGRSCNRLDETMVQKAEAADDAAVGTATAGNSDKTGGAAAGAAAPTAAGAGAAAGAPSAAGGGGPSP